MVSSGNGSIPNPFGEIDCQADRTVYDSRQHQGVSKEEEIGPE